MFLSKIQQSCFYSQLCNYVKAYVCKPFSNHLNILAGCNLSFTWTLMLLALKRMDNL